MSNQELLQIYSAYLPYGVKCVAQGYNVDNFSDPVIPKELELVGIIDCKWCEIHEIGRTVTEQSYFEETYLLLRPLSDLTNEIEHNGEKFVAGLKLVDPDASDWDKMTCEYYNAFPKIPNHEKWIQVKHYELGQVININPYNIGHLPYNIFQKLFEWHLDVFGLIEKGLAINLNEVK